MEKNKVNYIKILSIITVIMSVIASFIFIMNSSTPDTLDDSGSVYVLCYSVAMFIPTVLSFIGLLFISDETGKMLGYFNSAALVFLVLPLIAAYSDKILNIGSVDVIPVVFAIIAAVLNLMVGIILSVKSYFEKK